MRLRIWRAPLSGIVMATMMLCSPVLLAQDSGAEPLTIWIVRPVTAADRAVRQTQRDLEAIKQYRETTAGSFGKPASEVGQTAGSYGKSASEEGKPASEAGQTAGSYGQTAGSLPSNVTSQTAGSYGQTAGSFGQSASDFTGAPSQAKAAPEAVAARADKGWQWTEFARAVHEALPNLEIRVVEVLGIELRQRLASVGSSGAAPDVLLSDRMPDWWAAASRNSTLVELARSSKSDGRRQTVFHDAYGLANAPHPVAAREFLQWWNGQDVLPVALATRVVGTLTPPASVAVAAVSAVLSGSALDGLADRDAAAFSGRATKAEVLGNDNLPGDLGFRTDVVRAVLNTRLAVVALHTRCVSHAAYCDLYPLVMLRANERGEWKVLQVSVGLSASEMEDRFGLVVGSARSTSTVAEVAMPKLASPVDGDQRGAGSGLKLWWDNGGGASSLVVEWQVGSGSSAPASHILVVSDAEPKLSTELPAPFADVSGPVRWRVWALGQGGVVRMTGWRVVNMVR